MQLLKKKKIGLAPKEQPTSKSVKALAEGSSRTCLLLSKSRALDEARLFFWGQSISLLYTIGGIKWAKPIKNFGLLVCRPDNTTFIIPPIVMCTRDRTYARDYITRKINKYNTESLTWHMDMYDKEFHNILEGWKDVS
jgi:hypothetical protein